MNLEGATVYRDSYHSSKMMSNSKRKRLGQLIKKASLFWIRTPKIGRSTPARFNCQIETDISQYPKLFRV